MAAESDLPIPTTAPLPTAIKNPPNERDEWTLMMMIKTKKIDTNIKPVVESNKSCICSPTSHVGSFRCHLHRATRGSVSKRTGTKKLNSKEEVNLSRFGRASTLKQKPRVAS